MGDAQDTFWPSPSAPRQRSPTSGDLEDKLHKIRGLYYSGDEDKRREVLAGLDESEDGECPSGARFTYHKSKDGFKFDEKAFAAEHPELHAKYQALKPGYRTLRYSNKGKGK